MAVKLRTCTECGSDNLGYFGFVNISNPSDGRDCEAHIALGCRECSETLQTMPLDKWLAHMGYLL